MNIGEIVEELIYIKDYNALLARRHVAAIEQACNLLDKMRDAQAESSYGQAEQAEGVK